MEMGRNPARVVVPLPGMHNTDGADVLIGHNSNNTFDSMQHLRTAIKGNRCGHDKHNLLRLIRPENHKRRPHSIEEALRRLEEIDNRPNKYGDVTCLFFHAKDKGGRKRRSERLEATKRLVLSALLNWLGLQKMVFGYYNNRNEFHYFDYSKIQQVTGLSSIRIKRAIKDLKEQEILKVNIKRDLNPFTGEYRTKNVEIELTDKIFQMLELIPEFLADRDSAAKKFYDKQKRMDKKIRRLDIYRKPNFRASKPVAKPEVGIKSLTQKLTMNRLKVDKAPVNPQGQQAQKMYSILRAKGYSPQEAIELIKKAYPPPN